MALSGSAKYSVTTGYQLVIEWTATQSITTNKSTVTAKLYWESTGSSYSVSSSATKSGYITINGSKDTFSGAGLASLSGNEKKLIYTSKVDVVHNSDGTKPAFDIVGNFDMDVTLNGSMQSNKSVTDSCSLTTIPRKSELTSSASWTFPNNLDVTLDEKSSGFTHIIQVSVNGVVIRKQTGVGGESYKFTWTTAENQKILAELNKDTTYWNQSTLIELWTYSGSTQTSTYEIGYDTVTGTCTSATATTLSCPNFDIGDSVTYNINNERDYRFVYDITAKIGSYTKTLYAKTDLSSTLPMTQTWSTSGDKNSLLDALPTKNSDTVTWTITTYWNNAGTYTRVRNASTSTCTASIKTTERNPVWTGGVVTWKDTNTAVTSVTTATGTNASCYIVQGQSTLEVSLASIATVTRGTTIKDYTITVLGKPKSLTGTRVIGDKVTFVGSELNSASNIPMVAKVTDNRGNSIQFSYTINVVPYSQPILIATASRLNGFESDTTLTLKSTISLLNVLGANRNYVLCTPDPTVAPTLTLSANAGSTVEATTHYVYYTWKNSFGETLKSPQASIAVTAGQNLVVTIPALPTGVTQANIYMSKVAGTGWYQGMTTGTTYTRSTIIAQSGTALPTVYTASALEYQTKLKTASTYGSWIKFYATLSGSTYTATSQTITLDNFYAYDIKFKVTDRITYNTSDKSVAVGQPIMFIDSTKKSIGINMIPIGNNNLEINTGQGNKGYGVIFRGSAIYNGSPVSGTIWTGTGGIVLQSNDSANLHLGQNNTQDMIFMTDKIQIGKDMTTKRITLGASQWASPTNVTLAGLDINNSDIVGANSIFMADSSTSDSEAIQWAREAQTTPVAVTKTPDGSTNYAQYDSFRILNGVGYLNSKPIFANDLPLLWNGNVAYVSASQTITPKKALSDCPNGWILVWCDFDGTGTTGNNYDYAFTPIPKHFAQLNSGAQVLVTVPNYVSATSNQQVVKKIFVSDASFVGHDDNSVSATSANDVVLKYVFQW